jgi:murein DD-endopeptidase MepM/ murein hydrolase activator NlpD
VSNFFTPEFNNEIAPWNASLEPTKAIIPQLDANRVLTGGVGQEVNIPTLTPEAYDNIILPDDVLTRRASAAIADSNSSLPDSSVDLLTGQAMSEVYGDLSKFAAGPDFVAKMNLAFGENWDAAGAKALAEGWFQGDFSDIPPVKVVSSAEIAGANGAFAAATNTIYLSKEFLTQNAANPAAVADVLLEEIGHSVDARLNVADSPGDEGAIFAAVVQGKTFDATDLASLKAEDDSATIHLNGKEIQIEKASLRDPGLRTLVHIQDIGDRTFSEGAVAGTTGQSRRLEGFQINLDSPIRGLSMEYMAHIEGIGDTSWVREGQYIGTKNQSRRIEGFAIRLTGSEASKYDVFYQAHVEGIGDTARVGNGQFSGTRGQSRRVEAISVWVQPKPQSPLFSNPSPSNPLRGFAHPLGQSQPSPIAIGNHNSWYGQQYAVDLPTRSGGYFGAQVYAMRSGTVVNWNDSTPDKSPNLSSINDYREGTTANFLVVKLDDNDGVDDGYRTMYLHLQQGSIPSKFKRVGARVETNEPIGKVGYNGISQGVHLHAEVNKLNGNPNNMWQRQTMPFQWK